MNSSLRTSIAILCAVALPSPALLPLSAEENAPFDPAAASEFAGPVTVEVVALDMNRVVTRQTQFIRYEATEYQRKVAEQRARAFVAAHRRAEAAAEQTQAKTKPRSPTKPEPSKPEKPEKSKPQTKPAPSPPEAKAPAPVKKLPRYIAVDTVKDKRASPKAKKVVMIWDTHAETLVGNNLYDVENPPEVGSSTKFDTYSVEYIGAGL